MWYQLNQQRVCKLAVGVNSKDSTRGGNGDSRDVIKPRCVYNTGITAAFIYGN